MAYYFRESCLLRFHHPPQDKRGTDSVACPLPRFSSALTGGQMQEATSFQGTNGNTTHNTRKDCTGTNFKPKQTAEALMNTSFGCSPTTTQPHPFLEHNGSCGTAAPSSDIRNSQTITQYKSSLSAGSLCVNQKVKLHYFQWPKVY